LKHSFADQVQPFLWGFSCILSLSG
jgi:hypothetical protein